MAERSTISITVIKNLFAVSGNCCAFPSCNVELVRENQILGEICHIEGYSPKGPRYNKNSNDKERNQFDNLILLCGNCHKIVDGDERKYSTHVLHEYKKQHESQYILQPYAVSDDITSKIINKLENSLKEQLTEAYQLRDAKKLSKEHQTIVKIIEYLSSGSDIAEVPVEKEPDPEKKIMKRFQKYKDVIINSYVELRMLYEELRVQIEKEIGLSGKDYQLMVLKLKNDSKIFLKKCDNNPILALHSMQEEIVTKLEQKGVEYEEGAIRYCLYHRTIKCFIFPNEE